MNFDEWWKEEHRRGNYVGEAMDAEANARAGWDAAKSAQTETITGMAAAIEGAPTIKDAVMRAMREHYWDSLEPQKKLILLHIEGALRWLGGGK